MRPTPLEIAVRAYAIPVAQSKKKGGKERKTQSSGAKPDFVLVIDEVSSSDISQLLRFGAYRVLAGGKLVEEGFFYADDLPVDQLGALRTYCRSQNKGCSNSRIKLRLLSRPKFLKDIFYKIAFKARGVIVGFDLPFTLSRFAEGWSAGRKFYKNGFNFTMLTYEDEQGRRRPDSFAPRISMKPLDSKRAMIAFTSVRPEVSNKALQKEGYKCEFVDARTLAYAFSREFYRLDKACEAFGIEIQKNEVEEEINEYSALIHRVGNISRLYFALMWEFDKHPVDLKPSRAFSPASIGKAYFREMGLRLPTLKIDPKLKLSKNKVLGFAMASYYGGRTETRITKVDVPVAYCDFLSMYATVNTVMGTWEMLTAEQIRVSDATEWVKEFLEGIRREDLFDPEVWKELPVLVQVLASNDLLPMRAIFSKHPSASFTNALNYLNSDKPLWYTLADLVVSRLHTGKSPKILRTIRFTPVGTQKDLTPMPLRGEIDFDPSRDDLFKTIVEERQREKQRGEDSLERLRKQEFLKTWVNAMGYGVFAELNRQEDEANVEVLVHGIEGFTTKVDHPEDPGPYFFPPIATFTTAGARLMLALVELEGEALGGSYAFTDTDSIAIVSTELGGLLSCPGGKEQMEDGTPAIRGISWYELEQIRRKFERLNPYDPAVVPGSILRLEDENFRMGAQGSLQSAAVALQRHLVQKIRALQRG